MMKKKEKNEKIGMLMKEDPDCTQCNTWLMILFSNIIKTYKYF